MAFRCVMIENPAYISVKNNQLLIRTEQEHSLPIEDISALLLENRQITITTTALSRLGQCGCAVFTCDESHMPCAVLEPFMQHSRALQMIQRQLSMTEPLKKRLWQSVVQKKIINQAKVLSIAGKAEEAKRIAAMAERVRSGDTDNVEATAAQTYFPDLFGTEFTRADETGINAGLNYGYAILRGCIARMLAVYGFLPAIGIHHRSTLNAFNLADDLIEAYRPLIDLLVFSGICEEDTLTPDKKRYLFNCLNLNILINGKNQNVSYAIEQTVQSLSRSLSEGSLKLALPDLVELQQHRYE